MIDVERGYSPKPFEIMLDSTFNIVWRVARGTKVKAKMEADSLVLTFSYSVPTQTNIQSLNFPKAVSLQEHTLRSDRQLQPRKYTLKFLLPPTVIRENYTCHLTPDFIAFQFQVGKTANFEMDIPQ